MLLGERLEVVIVRNAGDDYGRLVKRHQDVRDEGEECRNYISSLWSAQLVVLLTHKTNFVALLRVELLFPHMIA